jgi:hypothetical protein
MLLKNTKPLLIFKTSKGTTLYSWQQRHLSYIYRLEPNNLFLSLTKTKAMVDYSWDFQAYFGCDLGVKDNQTTGMPITWCTVLMMNDERVYMPTEEYILQTQVGNLIEI